MSQKQVDNKPLHSFTTILKKGISIALPTLACIGVGMYISTLSASDVAIRASIDGVPCGFISSYSDMQSAAAKLENMILTATAGAYDPDIDISFDLVHTTDAEYLSEEDCSALLWNQIANNFDEAYMLYVDGRQIAANKSEAALVSLIDSIKAELLSARSGMFSSVRISNEIRIQKQLCLKSMLMSTDEIDAIINPIEKDASELSDTSDADVKNWIDTVIAASPDMSDNLDVVYGLTHGTAQDHDIDLTLGYNYVNTVTLNEEVPFETEYVDDPTAFIGVEKVIREGAIGEKRVTYELLYDANARIVKRTATDEEILISATSKVVKVGTKEIPDAVPLGNFIWPCATPKGISSDYGPRVIYGKSEFHLGIDLPDVKGSPIWASDGGKVSWAGFTPSYGNSVRIDHADGYSTLYAHLDKILVNIGDNVYQGQEIGKMGSTGYSYGSHLHFEIRINNLTYNPVDFLPDIVIGN